MNPHDQDPYAVVTTCTYVRGQVYESGPGGWLFIDCFCLLLQIKKNDAVGSAFSHKQIYLAQDEGGGRRGKREKKKKKK